MSDIAVAESGIRLQNFLDHAGLRGFPWKTATILYTISWGWLFIVHDSYWADDWVWFPEYVKQYPYPYEVFGLPPWFKLSGEIVEVIGPSGFRVILFFSFLCAAIFLFGILQKFKVLNLVEHKFLVLLFLLLPFNTARVALMCFNYTLSYFYFFAAWYLIVTFRPICLKILAVFLFLMSFQTQSILSFYYLPILHLFFLSESKKLPEIFLWARRNIAIVLLPVLYWVMGSIYWSKNSSYNDLTVEKLSGALGFMFGSGLIFLILYLLQKRVSTNNKSAFQIILFGAVAVFVGLLPYVVNGSFSNDFLIFSKYLTTLFGRSDWYSRHQMLQPLGIALLIVGIIGLLPKPIERSSRQVRVSLLSLCVIFNLGFGFEYVVDQVKQKEIVAQLKEIDNSDSVARYQIIDQTGNLNARGREYRYRDWQGLISLAYDSDLQYKTDVVIKTSCSPQLSSRFVLIQGPETHWQALKNWVSDGDMGFKVTVDDTPGACKPEMVTAEKVSGAIPILFYFTGAKN